MSLFAFILIFLACITVIGHLIWILCARLLGFKTLTVPVKAFASGDVCRHCGRRENPTRPARAALPPIPFAARVALQDAGTGSSFGTIKPPPAPLTAAAIVAGPASPVLSRPSEPRRSLSSIVSAFMEERNIRWGELVGGLLIVGCSIALVISFWAEISRQPFLRFTAMTGVTTALFGLGLYSEHRWKLPTTSRGTLLIATLLTPLNCLAFAAFSGSASRALLECELLSVILFALLLSAGARVIAPHWPGLLTFGTAGLSVSLLTIRFLETPIALSHAVPLLLLTSLPIACELFPVALVLARARRRRFIHGSPAEAIFLLLGVLLFGTILAIGLIVHDAPRWRWALGQIAPLIAIGAAPLLAGGTILHRRIQRAKFVHLRVMATAVAILATLVILLAVALGWPGAHSMLPTAVSAFVIFALIASLEQVPLLHLAGMSCLAFAWVLGFHLLRRDLSWDGSSAQMRLALSDSANAVALIPLLVAIAVASEWMIRRGASAMARVGMILIAGLGAIGVGLASWNGFGVDGDPHRAVWVYLNYGLGSLMIAIREKRRPFAWAGWLLIAAFFAQLFLTRLHPARPWEMALLVFASVTVLADWVAVQPAIRCSVGPGAKLGVTASAVAAILLMISLWPQAPTAYLLWLSAIWFAVAIRESSRVLLFVAQCIVHLAVTLAYLSGVSTAWHIIEAKDFVHAAQINSILFTAFAMLWNLTGRLKWASTKRNALFGGLASIDLALGVGLNAVLVLAAAALLALAPNLIGVDVAAKFAGKVEWAAWLSASAALLAATWRASDRRRASGIGTIAITFAGLIALSAASIYHDGWLGFHVLITANLLAAWGMALLVWWCSRFSGEPTLAEQIIAPEMNAALQLSAEPVNVLAYSRSSEITAQPMLPVVTNRWACAFALIVVSLATRGMAGDPGRATWSITPIVMISLLLAAMAAWNLQRAYHFGFALLLNLAATLWLIANPLNFPSLSLIDLANVNAIVFAACALATLVIELHLFRPNERFVTGGWPPFHDAAALGSLMITAVTTGISLFGTMQGQPIAQNSLIFSGALAATMACAMGRMWDSRSRLPIVGIYAAGLVIVAAIVAQYHLAPRETIWLATILLSSYTLLTAGMWRIRAGLVDIAQRVGVEPSHLGEDSIWWLSDANFFLAVCILVSSIWVVLTFAEISFRLAAAAAVVLQSFALGLLAPKQEAGPERAMPLAVGILGTILCAWAALSVEATLFQRVAVVLVVSGGWCAALSIALSRFAPITPGPQDPAWWPLALRQNLLLAGALAGTALLTSLVRQIEIVAAGGQVILGNLTTAVIAGSFAAACAVAVTLAAGGRTGSTALSDRARAGCVYLAELLLAFLFVHLRLSRPHWFGRLEPWWPLVVMGIAFASAAIAEVLRRTTRQVIAEPMHRTALFLPLIPTLGFLLLPSRVDFSLLLLIISLLYGFLALARRSTPHALLAGLVATFALWSELQRTPGAGCFEHPQLWLIPAGLLILAAGESNRRRLHVENLRLIRYLALSIIYLSSTADIFVNGVERAPWLPLVLAVLAIGGVLAGVSFRIKPLLFLGIWFLGVAMVTMIYYASRSLQWTWIWYVAGIALGGMIILIFALFEKKREHVLAMVNALKKWD